MHMLMNVNVVKEPQQDVGSLNKLALLLQSVLIKAIQQTYV